MGDEDRSRALVRIALFAAPLVGLAIWGMSANVGGEQVFTNDASLFKPSLVAGAVVALAFGVLTMRSFDEGNSVPVLLIAAAVGFVPASLASYGLLRVYNGSGRDDRDEVLACKVDDVRQGSRKRGGTGWIVAYTCEPDGEPLYGSYRSTTAPSEKKGDRHDVHASRGKLGVWVKAPEPDED